MEATINIQKIHFNNIIKAPPRQETMFTNFDCYVKAHTQYNNNPLTDKNLTNSSRMNLTGFFLENNFLFLKFFNESFKSIGFHKTMESKKSWNAYTTPYVLMVTTKKRFWLLQK